jgi:adenylate cyclase class IV
MYNNGNLKLWSVLNGGVIVKVELIREAKYTCEDFVGVRDVLNEIQAQCKTIKEQSDFIYKIYDPSTGERSKRIKVRIENENTINVYVYNRMDREDKIAFDYYEIQDREIISIFTSLYGKALVIRKVREVWTKDNIVFHLDIVEGVGNLFEIESLKPTDNIGIKDLNEYMKLFERFLLKQVDGSNEDLVLEGKIDGLNNSN